MDKHDIYVHAYAGTITMGIIAVNIIDQLWQMT